MLLDARVRWISNPMPWCCFCPSPKKDLTCTIQGHLFKMHYVLYWKARNRRGNEETSADMDADLHWTGDEESPELGIRPKWVEFSVIFSNPWIDAIKINAKGLEGQCQYSRKRNNNNHKGIHKWCCGVTHLSTLYWWNIGVKLHGGEFLRKHPVDVALFNGSTAKRTSDRYDLWSPVPMDGRNAAEPEIWSRVVDTSHACGWHFAQGEGGF